MRTLLFRFLAVCLSHFFILLLPAQNPEKPLTEMNWEELYEKWEALTQAGKDAAALPYIRASLEKIRQDSSEANLDYGALLDCLGYSLHHVGQFDEAEQTFQASLAHARQYQGKNNKAYISRLSNLAMLHLDMDEKANAISELESAVHLAENILKEDDDALPIILNNLGLAYEQMGDMKNALKYYRRAMELTERTLGKEHLRYGIRLCNMAGVYRRARNFEKALELDLQGLSIFENKVGKNHARYIAGLNATVMDYMNLSRFPEALARAETLQTAIDSIPLRPSPETYDYTSVMAELYYASGQYDRCIAYTREAMTRFIPLFPLFYSRHMFLTKLAMQSFEKTGKVREAAGYASQGYHYALLELRENFNAFSEHEQLRHYEGRQRKTHMPTLLFTFRHPEFPELAAAAYEYQMTVKGLALDHRRQLFQSLRENPDTAIRIQFTAWKQLQNDISRQYALSPHRREIDLDSLLTVSNELERNLAIASETFRLGRQPIHWHDVLDALAPGAAAVEFARLEMPGSDSVLYVAWILRSGDAQAQQVYLFEEKEVGNLSAIRRIYAPETSGTEKNLRQLLWKPLEPFLKDISTLYYAPAGILHQINPGAVPISATEVMDDRFRMHRLVSTRQILYLKRDPAYSPPVSALVFGGIRYDSDSLALAPTNTLVAEDKNLISGTRGRGGAFGTAWNFLPGSYDEAQSVRQSLERVGAQAVLVDGFRASEGFLKKSVQPPPSVLHLATHGFFLTAVDTIVENGFATAENPMARTGLALSGANRVWSGDLPFEGQEDGILTALEISRLDLGGTELAVLSACGTGQGQVEAGEGILGLQRAFKMAGTHYVIMTLWNVQDHHARAFMDLFYGAWLGQGQDIPEAFRVAQGEMRRRYGKPFQPGVWAGFLLLE